MEIFFDNVGFAPVRGPSCFAGKLARLLKQRGVGISTHISDADIHLAFIGTKYSNPGIPLVQRLDGIYFSSKMDNDRKNKFILDTYKKSDFVIVQSEFDRKVAFNFFGERGNTKVIPNGADYETINEIEPLKDSSLDKFDNIWVCASRWEGRGHKRLHDNIRYFSQHSGENDCLVVAGDVGVKPNTDRIFYWGSLEWKKLLALCKRAKYFIHLAMTDHCPNVVVDARGCGCKIICSSLGGTEEVAGKDAIVIEDMEWDFKTPFDYRNPPTLDFTKKREGKFDIDINMNRVVDEYISVFKEVL